MLLIVTIIYLLSDLSLIGLIWLFRENRSL